jgi:hypothetical protein
MKEILVSRTKISLLMFENGALWKLKRKKHFGFMRKAGLAFVKMC